MKVTRKKGEIPYLERDISWMYFNRRILSEAEKAPVPLLERLSFLGIYSNNLDEFYRVRVATLNRIIEYEDKTIKAERETAIQTFREISRLNALYTQKFEETFTAINTALRQNRIYLLNEQELQEEQADYIREFYKTQLIGSTTPLFTSSFRHFSDQPDDHIYLSVCLQTTGKTKKDFAIIEALNSTKSIADMFDFDILEKLSGLDGKQMKKDIVMCVDERKFMLPMIYINYRALGISMHMYLVRMFQNVPSYRKAEIVDEFSLMPEFVDILQFGDSFYDCMLTVYTEVNDVEAIRRMLEGYAEIEEVKVANSKRQFRRWVARLDDDNGYWEECVMTDDFLQNRLESGSVKCRFSTDSEEVQ